MYLSVSVSYLFIGDSVTNAVDALSDSLENIALFRIDAFCKAIIKDLPKKLPLEDMLLNSLLFCLVCIWGNTF